MCLCVFLQFFGLILTKIQCQFVRERVRHIIIRHDQAKAMQPYLDGPNHPKNTKRKTLQLSLAHTHRYLVINPVMLDDKSFWNHRELQSLCKRYVTVQFVDAYCPIYKFQHDLGSYSTDHSHMLQNMFVFAGFHYLLVQTKEKVS